MERRPFRPVDVLLNNWQVILIASLPGSLWRVWAVLSTSEVPPADAEPAGLVALVALPLLAAAALLLHEAYGERLPVVVVGAAPANAPPPRPPRLDAITQEARELLAAVSLRGEFRLAPRFGGPAVVACGTGADDDREFCDPSGPAVSQRYRYALAELERVGLVERDGELRRLTAMGWPAARLLVRQELDRIARCTRHLSQPEQRLLRLIADCQQRHKVRHVLLRRDGSAISAVHGGGLTIRIADLSPLDEALPNASGDPTARFTALVTGIPDDYLTVQPERRLGNFVVRLTAAGLRYLRCADVAGAVASGGARPPSAASPRDGTDGALPALASTALN